MSNAPLTKTRSENAGAISMKTGMESRFAMASAQISDQTRSMPVSAICGPGWIPSMTKAPIRIAMPEDPGTPKNSVGKSEPPSFELFAVSGAITPRTSPLPKFSGFFEDCTAWP